MTRVFGYEPSNIKCQVWHAIFRMWGIVILTIVFHNIRLAYFPKWAFDVGGGAGERGEETHDIIYLFIFYIYYYC